MYLSIWWNGKVKYPEGMACKGRQLHRKRKKYNSLFAEKYEFLCIDFLSWTAHITFDIVGYFHTMIWFWE